MKIKLNINGKEIEAEISEEELKKIEGVESGRVELNKSYWAISGGGDVMKERETEHRADDWRYLTSNYFLTQPEAQEYRDYLQAVGEIKQYIRENGMSFVPDWEDFDQDKYHLFYQHESAKWGSIIVFASQCFQVLPFLQTNDHAEKVVKNCAPQLEVVRKYLIKNK